MSEELTSVAPEQHRSCWACLLSNTCLFLLGRTAEEKKECVQGGWEKFEVCARRAVKDRHCARLRTDMLNLSANRRPGERPVGSAGCVCVELWGDLIHQRRAKARESLLAVSGVSTPQALFFHPASSEILRQHHRLPSCLCHSLYTHTQVNTHAHSLC